jgi:polyether ionophore transport system permease protein
MTATRALVGLHARMLHRGTLVLALLFLAASYAIVQGYEGLYPAGSDRSPAVALGENPGFRAILGSGAGLDTAGGFTAWRFGGPAVIIIAVWSYLAATRLLRGEEDARRAELLWAGAITGSTVVRSVMAVVAAGTVVVAAGAGLGMMAGGAPAAGSALTAASIAIGGFVLGAFGVVAAQVLPTRRAAALTAGGVVVGAFLVRAVANTKAGLEWLRWATPFGWSELVRPFGDRTALPFVVAFAVTAVLASIGAGLARHRDLGGAIVPDRPSRAPREVGLGSSLGFAGRQGLPRAAAWLVPLLVVSTTFGLLSHDVGEFFRSNETFRDVFERFGVDPSVPVRAFLGFVVSTFAIVGVCFGVSEVGAAREEEAATRLDNLLTRAVTRRSWLVGRLLVTVVGVVALAVALAAGAGAGAAWGGAHIAVAEFTTVAVNAVPVALCFLGITALVFAAAPRATTAIGFGLVGTAFVWQIVGSAISAPQWSLDLTPFAHVAPVPAQGMNAASALALAGLGIAGCIAAVEVFARRDLQEA